MAECIPGDGQRSRVILNSARALRPVILVGLLVVMSGALAVGVARAGVAGDLDPTFGTGGVSTVPGGGAYETLLAQPDGKILAGGFVSNAGLYFATVARFNEHGTLDPTFGNAGVTTFAYGDQFHGGEVFALELQPDGRILAGGTTNIGFALARLNNDGSLDTSFGTGGVSAPAMSEGMILDLALQPDGSVFAAGRIGSVFGSSGQHRLGLVRFNADGTVDAGFGTNGVVDADFASGYLATALFQSDGSILAAGSSVNFADFQLAHYAPGGVLDTSFGTGGYAFTDFSPSDAIQGLAVQLDGAIVAAGASINRGDDFALARYSSGGTPDTGFGQGGKVETEFTPFDQALAYAVAVQPDGKIVVGGCARNCDRLALARYNTDGSLDAGFGEGGLTASDTIADVPAIMLQQDGKIIASAGGHNLVDPRGNTLVRLLGTTTPNGDVTPPSLVVPAGMTANASSPSGTLVSYIVSATDDVDGTVPVTCAPVSGSTFSIGTTTVTCTAADASGNSSSASFSVHVKGAPEQVADLIALVDSYNLGLLGTALHDKLVKAQGFLAANKPKRACEVLDRFLAQVKEQRGKRISVERADRLTTDARRNKAVIGC